MIENQGVKYTQLQTPELEKKLGIFQNRLNNLHARFANHLKTEHKGAMRGVASVTCHTCINLKMMMDSYEDRIGVLSQTITKTQGSNINT